MNVNYKKSKLLNNAIYFSAYLVWVGTILFVFNELHKVYFKHLNISIESQFKSDNIISNMNFLYRTFMQYESQGLIRCSKLERQNQVIFDLTYKEDCRKNNFFVREEEINENIIAINGQSYQISYKIINPKQITFLLIAALFFGAVLVFTFFRYFNLKMQNIEKIKDLENKKNQELFQLSFQLSHDIRSPLSALNLISQKINFDSEDLKSLYLNSIERINAISNDLLNNAKPIYTHNNNVTDLAECLNVVFKEKKTLLQDQKITFEFNFKESSFPVFIPKHDLIRILSNIINNSIEAVSEKENPKITINIETNQKITTLKIFDNGSGIKKENLKFIGKIGFSTKNSSGNGIGLNHAIQTLNSYEAKLSIQSKENEWTEILITFPNKNFI